MAAVQPAAAQQNYSGITISPSSLAVWEGESRTYTVTMTTEPQGTWDQVHVYIKLADESIVAVSGSDVGSLPPDPEFAGMAGFVFFNRLDPNFQSKKTMTVTLTGADDSVVDTAPRRVTIGHDVQILDTQTDPGTNTILSSRTDYASVSVTLKDDDVAGIGVEPGALTVWEANDTSTPAYENEVTYRVRLNADPGAGNTVTVTPASGNTGTATLTHPLTGVTPSSLTFTGGASGNWDATQTVTVYGVDDVFDNYRDRRTARITHTISGYPAAAGTPADDPVTVTVTDDDGAVLTVDDARATEGGDLVFTVRLDGANVRGGLRVTPTYTGGTATAGTDYTRNTTALAFSGSKGETHTFTVGTTQDSSMEGDETVMVGLSVSGTPIGVKATDTATGTIVDDDTAGVTVSTSALTVAENATAIYTVKLNTDPGTAGTVTVTTGGVSSEVATVSPSTLTFTGGATGNWATAQVVSVTGADDTDRQDGIASIVHTVTGYGAVRSAAPVTLTVIDDDTTMLSVSPPSLTLGENGGKQSYTIRVTPPNVENWQSFYVVIRVSDETVATLEQGTFLGFIDGLAFEVTPQNYTTPVTVTVVGVDDDIDNAIARKTTVHHEIIGAGGRANLAPVSVTLTDDDTPGVSVAGPPNRGIFDEGTSVSHTVVLNSQPTGAATVTTNIEVWAADQATIEPASVTFTPDNWNIPQTITVTAVDNDVDDGYSGGIFLIRHTVSGYGSVKSARQLQYEILDNDTRGITLSETALTVSETDDPDTPGTAENIATYTVVLDTQPDANWETVTVKPSVPDGSAATVSPETLTFNSGNWDTPQTVTVTAADDDIDTADRSVEVSHAVEATEHGSYRGFRLDAKVKVTVEDDDTAGVTVSEAGVSVAEIDDPDTSGTKESEATWTVVLDSEPAETVTVEVSVPDGGAATVSPPSLTFTGGASGNWDTPQTVTARAVNDDIANSPDRTAAVSHAVSGYGSVIAAAGVTVTVRDDDAEPGFGSESIPDQPWVQSIAVDETLPEATGGNGALIYDLSPNLPAGLTFDAAARTITGTPTALLAATEYTWTVTDADGDEAELTFSATVTADTDPAFPANTSIADGIWTRNVKLATVTLPAATGGNAPLAYDLSPDPPAGLTFDAAARTITGTPTALLAATEYTWTVTDTDGDEAELTFSVTVTERVAGLAVAPVEGETTKLGVSWTAWPGAASHVVRWKTGGGYPDANKASLGATASTYEISGLSAGTDYTVRVDAYDDSSPPRLLAHAEASGTTLAPAPGVTVSATVLTVTEVDDPNTADKTEHQATYTVVLDAQPSADVTVTPATTAGTVIGLSGALTFTSTNWSTPRTVTVTAKDDAIDNAGDQRTARVTHTVAGAGSGYESVTAAAVDVTVSDDDGAPSGVTLTVDTDGATDGNQASVSEGAGATTVTVTAALTGGTTFGESKTVTVAVGSDSDTAVEGTDYDTVADFSITVAAGSSSGSGTFTLTPTDDDSDEGDETLSVSGTLGSLTVAGAEVTITDDDTVGVTVSETALTVAEMDDPNTSPGKEHEATYTVVLDAQPAADVTVTPATTASTVVGLSGALTFTSTNWSTPRTVTVTGKNDDADNAGDKRTARVTHTVSGAGSGYESVTAAAVDVTVTDDDDAPSGVTLTVDTDSATTGNQTSVAESAAATTVTVTAALTGGTTFGESKTVTVAVGSDSDTAVEGTDYDTVADFSIAIAAGTSSGSGTFTLTPTDDDSDEGDEKLSVGGTLAGLTVTGAEVTITDDDTAGVTVSATALTVAEVDDTDTADKTEHQATYTVVLDAQPAANVTVTPATTAGTVVGLSGALTFTTSNWDDAQTVTVTAKDDAIDNAGDKRTARVTHTVAGAGSGYESVTAAAVDVTVSDDDAPSGVTLTVDTDGATDGNQASVSEGAGATTVTVTAALTGGTTFGESKTVTVAVGSDSDTAVEGTDYDTVADFSITVAAGSSSGSGTFTLTPTDDDSDEGDETLSVSGTLGSLTVTGAEVTITDNDTVGVTVSETALTVAEVDDTDTADKTENVKTYTVVLDAQPAANVTVTPATTASTVIRLSGALTFTSTNWSTPQTVTVTAKDDDADNANDKRTARVTHTVSGAGSGYESVVAAAVDVTVTDDDTAGVTVSETALTVAEVDDPNTSPGKEHEATYTVVLDAQPAADVTVTPATTASTVVGLSGALTFTSTNWSTPRTVTVTAKDDDVDNANDKRTARVTHTVSGAGSGYESVTVAAVDVTVSDDDTESSDGAETDLTVTPLSVEVAEDGGTVTLSIKLANDPAPAGTEQRLASRYDTDVYIERVTRSDGTTDNSRFTMFDRLKAISVDPEAHNISPLQFTAGASGNWATARTVTITGRADDVSGDRTVKLRFAKDTPGSSVETVEVTVTVKDDEGGGLTFTPSQVRVTEAGDGSAKLYTVALSEAPAGDTTVRVSSEDGKAATASPSSLTFTTASWSTPQTVTVRGVSDAVAGERRTRIAHRASDSVFGWVRVTVRDDDAGMTVSKSSLSLFESGGGNTATYKLALDAKPTGAVTVDIASRNGAVATVSPTSLLFTPQNFATGQVVTVTGTPHVSTSDRSTTIAHEASGGGYDGVEVETVDVTVRHVGPSVLNVPVRSVTVGENGGTATYTVRPRSDPGAGNSLVVSVSSSDETVATASPSTLTFTSQSWTVAQTVTVTGVSDDKAGGRRATITNTVQGRSETHPVTVTVTDDDGGITVSKAAVEVAEAGGTASWTVVLDAEPTGDVRVTPTSGTVSAATVSPEYLDFTTTSWSTPQTVTATGVDDDEDNAGDKRTATVTHRGLGGGYDDVSAATVEVTVTDDDWSGDVGGEGGTMRVSWSGFPEATGYRVQWRAEGESYSTSERVHTADAAAREYLVTGLTVGEKYYVRVTPLGGQGGETELAEPEEFEHFTPDYIDLYADPAEGDARSIEVEWERVRGAAGYALEWDVASSGCDALGTTPALAGGRKDVTAGDVPEGEIVFRDRIDGLTPDTDYYVRVTAYSPYGSFAEPDGLSWTDCATPTNTEITEVTVAAVGGSSTALDVSWAIGSAANAFPIVGYVVRWKTAGGEYDDADNRANEAAVDGGTTYRIEGLSAGTAYTVKVTARIREFPDLPHVLYDGDSAEKDGQTGGGSSGEPPAATDPLTFRVYHDSDDAEAVVRYDAGLAALRAAGVEPAVVEAKGDGVPARLSGHAVVRLPRFFVGEPLDSGQYPPERNGGLRWLRAYLASGPRLAVADARVSETGGGSLAFRVTLRGGPGWPVTVDFTTADGTATAGADYTATAGRLTFAPGETQKTVSVSVLDDAHDEGEETLRLMLSNPSGAWFEDKEATGTIVNTDAMPGAWLARMGRTVGSQAVDALGSRFAEGGGSHGTVGGQRITAGGSSDDTLGAAALGAGTERPWWRDPRGSDPETRTMTLEELLLGTSFHLSSGESETGGPSFAAWGRFARDRFEGEAGGTSMDGDVTTAFLGADAAWDRMLAGVLVSHSRSEGTYHGADGPGTVESTLTGVYPYARLSLSERVSAWGLVGMGEGELTLDPDGEERMETDVSLRMGALGVTGRLLDGAEGRALDVKSDALWVGTESDAVPGMAASESDVTRLRLVLDGSRVFQLGDGATFTPSAQAGVRVDDGDAETGTGVELGAGVSYTAGRLVIEGAVRGLVAHEASGYEEWGASGAVRLEPGVSGRGLSLTVNPAWGNAANDTEKLWQARDAGELGLAGDFEAQARLEAELGYGFALGRAPGVVTPYVGFTGAGGESRAWRTGARWRIGPDATLGLEAVRNESAEDNAPEHGVMLRCAVRW